MRTSRIATVEVPFEALVKELGAKRAIEFTSEIRKSYRESVVELRKATEKLTIQQIEAEIKALKKEGYRRSSFNIPPSQALSQW